MIVESNNTALVLILSSLSSSSSSISSESECKEIKLEDNGSGESLKFELVFDDAKFVDDKFEE